jgi:hypothetical protein
MNKGKDENAELALIAGEVIKTVDEGTDMEGYNQYL